MAGSEEAVSDAETFEAWKAKVLAENEEFTAWLNKEFPHADRAQVSIAASAWQAARSLPVVVTEPWVSADEKMPPFPGYVLIARWYVSENVPNGVWIYYTGYESEMRKPPYETCWFADDDELVPLADTWWKPIGIPPSLSATLNTTTHTAEQRDG
jgi:hypothetical protein